MKLSRVLVVLGLCLISNTYAESESYTAFNKPQQLKKLSKMQYDVTQDASTEPKFNNSYWNNKQAGIYVDLVSGEPLFSSTDKYDSGTGWPSFSKPIDSKYIVTKNDDGFFTKRTEVSSRYAKSHLGHVFADGPKPTGMRYCMNSAALHFIPESQMSSAGYSKYLYLFKK